MSNRKLKTAIIGVGGVSQLQYFPGVHCDPRAELVAICDANPELLDQRSKQWGVRQVYEDYAELLDQVDLDGVIVATPNCLHQPIVSAAVQRGRHVLCEKPLGLNAEQVRAMYCAARDAGIVHMTAFTYRFPPATE